MNVLIFQNTRIYSLKLHNKSEQKLGSTPVVHAMVLKQKYVLLKHEYHNKYSNKNIQQFKRQTCNHILFSSPFLFSIGTFSFNY